MEAFYLDEDVSVGVARELQLHGHAVTTTVGEGRLGAPDAHQLLYAAERNWVLVTHNSGHVRTLHDAWLLWSHRWGTHHLHAGILALHGFRRQMPADIADAIATLLMGPSISLPSSLYEWKRSNGWVRFPD